MRNLFRLRAPRGRSVAEKAEAGTAAAGNEPLTTGCSCEGERLMCYRQTIKNLRWATSGSCGMADLISLTRLANARKGRRRRSLRS